MAVLTRAPWSGTLRTNEVFSALFNMILGQRIMFPDTANNYDFLSMFREEGGQYGDQKIYYDSDVLSSRKWLGDAEAANLLDVKRPAAPKAQSIILGQMRIVDITVDNYLSKRAWSDEGTFSQFNDMIISMITNAKEMHETCTLNAFIGSTDGYVVEVPVSTATQGLSGEEKSRVRGQLIAKTIADVKADMMDYSNKYNDYHFRRAYAKDKLKTIFNVDYKNSILKTDYPTTYDSDGLIDFGKEIPGHYMTTPINSMNFSSYMAATATAGKPIEGSGTDGIYVPGTNNANGKLVALVEKEVEVNGTTYKVMPGDELPAGVMLVKGGTNVNNPNAFTCIGRGYNQVSTTDTDSEFGIAQDNVICKICSTDTFKFLTGFTIGTEFYNPKSLTQNHYLIWTYGIDRLKGQPLVTLKEV